jgi:tetratricopeptide (TPR) repeat protein
MTHQGNRSVSAIQGFSEVRMTASPSLGHWNRCPRSIILLLAVLYACTPAVSYVPTGPASLDKGAGCQPDVYPPGQSPPRPTATIGEITVGDTGLTVVCDYEHVLELAKSKACAEGADAVQLLEVKSPSVLSTCYEIRAQFLRYGPGPSQQPSPTPGQYSYRQGDGGAGGIPQVGNPGAPNPCYDALSRSRWDEAIAVCSREIAATPGSFHAYNHRGLAYMQKNELDRALADFNVALKIAPRDPVLFINRGRVHQKKGMPDLALADLRRAETLADSGSGPDDVAIRSSTLFSLGLGYMELNQYDLALHAFRKSNTLAPSALNLGGIGDCYSRQGNHREAALHFMRASEMEPSIAHYHGRLGQEYYWLGRYDEATQAMETGLLKAHNESEKEQISFNLAYTHVAKGDYRRASEILGQRKTLGVQISQGEGGIRVDGVYKGSTADLAGLLPGDLMVEFNGESLRGRTPKEFTDGLERTPFGSTAQIRILRDRGHATKQVIVGVTPRLAGPTPKDPPGSSQARADSPTHPAPSRPTRPSLEIHKVDTKPRPVSPGSAFELAFEFTVTAPSGGSTQVPVEFSYQILDGERVAFESKATQVQASPGVRKSWEVKMNASKNKGRYAVKVLLKHGDRTAEASAPLVIE